MSPTPDPAPDNPTQDDADAAPEAPPEHADEAPQQQPPAPTRSRLWLWGGGVAIALWLGVQSVAPMSPFFVEPHAARTDFSWDMFAVRRDCEQCHLTYTLPGQPPQRISWRAWFRSPFHVARARNRQRLPKLARDYCKRFAPRQPGLQVHIVCQCRYNKSATLYNLDPLEGGDYCADDAARRFDN